MDLSIIFLILLATYIAYRIKFNNKKPIEEHPVTSENLPLTVLTTDNNLSVYEDELFIAGVFYHKESVLEFMSCRDKQIGIRPEPDNPHDSNAINVIGLGVSDNITREFHIGYIPREQALALHRLQASGKIYSKYHPLNDQDYDIYEEYDIDLGIAIQLLGPSEGLKDYQLHIRQAFNELTIKKKQQLNSEYE